MTNADSIITGQSVILELGGKLTFVTNQNQFQSGNFIEGQFRRTHCYMGSVVTPHGVECDNFLSHLIGISNKYGRYLPPVSK
jgi:hypothetical protein